MPLAAKQLLDQEFLETRAKILQVAAALDRLDRAGGDLSDDPRMRLIRQGIETLLDNRGARAEQVQLAFSLPYHQDWKKDFGLEK